MKKIKTLYSGIFQHSVLSLVYAGFITMLTLLLFSSCNFNYPEEKQEPMYSTDLVFHYETGTPGGVADFTLFDFGSVPYQVIVYPKWIDVKNFEGTLNNGYCSIPFQFNNVDSYVSNGRAEGYIFVRVGKTEIFRITVTYGVNEMEEPPVDGQVPLYCSTAEINFGLDENHSFTIANQGQVDKNWYITDIPSWLALSQTSGYLPAGVSLTIDCTVNRDGLNPGDYSQIIQIESNNPQLSHGVLMEMTVAAQGEPVNSSTLKWFSGTVMDAYYCKATDYIYILTKSPNNLLVKMPGSDTLQTYPLERIPNCLDVTGDGTNLAIGYNQAYVELWDANTMERIKLYETDCVPFDLVFGENGWCYLSPDVDQWVHLYSLNLNYGVTHRTTAAGIYEKSILRKMPGKPYLFLTRPRLSPSGLLIVNIEDGAANDTIAYWHEDTGANLWLSEDGGKIIGGDKEIYRTPDYTTAQTHPDIFKIGTVDIPGAYIRSLDYNKHLQCYFVVSSDYWWGTDNSSTIYQVDEISFSANQSVKVSHYPGRVNNVSSPAMDVHYVFSNAEGNRLFAVKNVQQNLEVNYWALEILDLPLN